MSALEVNDTIAAIASPAGGAIRGIIRLSGPQTAACLESFFEPDDATCSPGNSKTPHAISGKIILGDNLALPSRVLLWPSNRSYTRQPTAELHTIGSPPLLELALATVCQAGARLAEPGEFTLRSFLSGRIDLTQAEAVLAVIDAEGREQLDKALNQLAGGLTGPLAAIRRDLIHILAELEAGLDFVEEDIEFISQQELENRLQNVTRDLEKVLNQIESRDSTRSQVKVALIGLPNAGKSSLLNALAGEQKAIVAPVEGTTRDFVSVTIEINGLEIELIDTAGVEGEPASDHSIEASAQVQTQNQLNDADIRILCVDSSQSMQNESLELVAQLDANDIVAFTKSDLAQPNVTSVALEIEGIQQIETSSKTDAGLTELKEMVFQAVVLNSNSESPVVTTTIVRAASNLINATESTREALHASQTSVGLEIVAAELRRALDELGLVVGTIYNDDILDQIFGKFCIGK